MRENVFQVLYKQRHLLESGLKARSDRASFSEKWINSTIVPGLTLIVFIFLTERSEQFPFGIWLLLFSGVLGFILFAASLIGALTKKSKITSINVLGLILSAYSLGNLGFYVPSAILYFGGSVLVFYIFLKDRKAEINTILSPNLFAFLAAYSPILINWLEFESSGFMEYMLLSLCLGLYLTIGFWAYKNIASLLILISVAFVVGVVCFANLHAHLNWLAPYAVFLCVLPFYEIYFCRKNEGIVRNFSDFRIFLNQFFYFICIALFFILLDLTAENIYNSVNLSEVLLPAAGIFILFQILFHIIDTRSNATIRILICICACLLYTSPSPRDLSTSRMPSSA